MLLGIPDYIQKACRILQQKGFSAYIVGGAVRDSLLGLMPSDWDLTTDARPEQIENLFSKTIPTGKRFGTITVFLAGHDFEITTMRKDGPYGDSRRPNCVFFTPKIELDLARRDFTINALAYDPIRDVFVDPYGGQKDLRKKQLTAVGDARLRFQEDPLRMLRLIRFQATLAFKINKKTMQPLPELAPLIKKVSPERILMEMNKILLADNLSAALQTLYTSGLLTYIIPELAQTAGLSAGPSHPYDLLGHSIMTAHFVYPSLTLRWAALLHDLGKITTLKREHEQISAQMAKTILTRLKASNELKTNVADLINNHMFSVNPHSTDRAIRRFLANVGVQQAFDLIRLRQADQAGMNADPRQILAFSTALETRFNSILEQDQALTYQDLMINGYDLIAGLNIKAGPLVGEILQYLLEQVWDNPSLNQQETLFSLARTYLELKPETPRTNADPR